MTMQYPAIGSTDWGDKINGNFTDLDSRTTDNANKIGVLNNLPTTDKTSTVVAIKEIYTDSTRTTTSKTVTGAINELNSNKLNISDLYKENFKDGMVSFASCIASGSGNYRVFQPTDYPSSLGYTSNSDFFVNVKILTSDYWMITAYDLRTNRILQQKKINGVVQNWVETFTSVRTVVTATPATGINITRQNIFIENKTLYGEIMVGKTDGTLFDTMTYLLFTIPNTGIAYNRTVNTSHWYDLSVLVNGSSSATLLTTGGCYVLNSIAGTKYISVSFALALEV